MARVIKCILPFNLRRLGGTLAEANQRLEALPAELRAAASAAIESAYHDLLAPIETHFFNDAPPPQLLDKPDRFHHCIQIIEEIVQIKRRLEVFAVAAAFPVLIQSDITPPGVADNGVATIDLDVSMAETATRFKNARAVVSLSHVNDEIHNRTLNALNAGAVNIVEDNAVHRRFFTHGVNALLFRYGDNSLHEALDLVCSRPDRAYEIAQAAMALRDDPRLKLGGFDNFVALAG
jgi:glycosyl transferase family 1